MDSRWESTSPEAVLAVSVLYDCDDFKSLILVMFTIGVGVAGLTLGGGKLKLNKGMRLKFSDLGSCRIFMAH
jgi:hypothetical protein